MNYADTVEWMFNQLPMYQQQGASAFRKDLTNTLVLADYLEHPEKNQKFIHVAGTNGKGSVSHMLASILMESGYTVGLFTSPHLKDFRERIKINGQEIPKDIVVEFIDKHRQFFESRNLSFFEMSVGLAFDFFKSRSVDISVIETGLGGRLDSTNIITPLLSVITNISFDHVQYLGNTLESIAGEKAGIIKAKIPVVVGEYVAQTKSVFLTKAKELESEIYFASDFDHREYESDLMGNYQITNKKTVLQSISILRERGFIISDEALKSGLLNVVKNTGLQGRWQSIGENPTVICDTAHNKHGLEVVMQQVKNAKYEKLHIVLGVVNDKDLQEILPIFPKEAIYYFCSPNISRGLPVNILQQKALENGLHGKAYDSVPKAYEAALQDSSEKDFIYIGGSTFVVAEIL